MEDNKTKILTTLAITGFFLLFILSNYTLISYYTTKYQYTESAIVKSVYLNKSKRSTTGRLCLKVSMGNEVTSDISVGSINHFYPGSVVSVKVYKNLLGDKYYAETNYGKLNLWGPTLGYFVDSISLLMAYLIISSNRAHRKNVGKENVRKMDKVFKIQLLIALTIVTTITVFYFFLRP